MERNKKPVYYLWKSIHMSQKELTIIEEQKRHWTALGYRVVVLNDGQDKNIIQGIEAIIKNHING